METIMQTDKHLKFALGCHWIWQIPLSFHHQWPSVVCGYRVRYVCIRVSFYSEDSCAILPSFRYIMTQSCLNKHNSTQSNLQLKVRRTTNVHYFVSQLKRHKCCLCKYLYFYCFFFNYHARSITDWKTLSFFKCYFLPTHHYCLRGSLIGLVPDKWCRQKKALS